MWKLHGPEARVIFIPSTQYKRPNWWKSKNSEKSVIFAKIQKLLKEQFLTTKGGIDHHGGNRKIPPGVVYYTEWWEWKIPPGWSITYTTTWECTVYGSQLPGGCVTPFLAIISWSFDVVKKFNVGIRVNHIWRTFQGKKILASISRCFSNGPQIH